MNQHRLTLWVVWSSLQMSLAIYAVIALLGVGGSPSDPDTTRLMALALGLIAVPTAAATFVLRRVLLTRPIAEGRVDPASESGMQRVQTANILIWALCEAIGIWGLVLWFLSSRWELLLPFLAAGSLLLALHAPRSSYLDRHEQLKALASGEGTIG